MMPGDIVRRRDPQPHQSTMMHQLVSFRGL